MTTENGEGQTPENNPQPPVSDNGQDDKPTLTQAEIDKIIGTAKRTAKGQAAKEIFESLGVENLDQLKTALADLEATKAAQMTDLEKAQAEAAKANELAKQAKAEADQAKAQATQMLMDAAIITASQGFNDPNDALQFIDRSGIERAEDGTFSGITEAIKALAESKPYLLKATEPATPKGTPTRQRNQPQGQPQGQNVPNAWETTKRLINF